MRPISIPLFARTLRDTLTGTAHTDELHLDALRWLPTALFFACIAFYGIYLSVMQAQWVWSGEMWAEMATNYFVNANAPSLVANLFAIDAGYVPLPQRLLAWMGHLLRLPAAVIPFFYTWSAILITGALVATFCLRPFRALVKSDWSRFFVAISVLLVADFETRTFINFTYFIAFFVAIVSALAIVNRSSDVPWWAWCIPVLMVSKPALLAVLPTMVMAALVCQERFRRVVYVTVFLCSVHLLVMIFGLPSNPVAGATEHGLLEKLLATAQYFIGFAGAFFVGKNVSQNLVNPLASGLIFLALCAFAVYAKRSRANALILVGTSLLFLNVLLNAFAMADSWNEDMHRLAGTPVYRHIIVGYFGVILVVVALSELLSEHPWARAISRRLSMGPILYLLWFVLSGWLASANTLNRAPGVPAIFNSQWQLMSETIDGGEPVCVPVDPIGWIFERNCQMLNIDVSWGKTYKFERLPTTGERGTLAVTPLPVPPHVDLMSLAVLAKPPTHEPLLATAKAVFHMKDGSTRYLRGARQLRAAGGLIHFTGKGVIPFADIQAVALEFDTPVELAYVIEAAASKPAIIWMGQVRPAE